MCRTRRESTSTLSLVDALRQWRTELQDKGRKHIPQLASSHLMDVKEQPIYIGLPQFESGGGRKRALLIGICYQGQVGELVRVCAFTFGIFPTSKGGMCVCVNKSELKRCTFCVIGVTHSRVATTVSRA
jgi:hypothetical protein